MRIAWRIAADTPDYAATDLSGKGAETTGGRWNRPGLPLVYAASNVSLAYLETVVHLNAGALPLNRLLVRIEIPDELWDDRVVHDEKSLPPGWDVLPAGVTSLDVGDAWLKAGTTAVMEVPSAIVPMESNVLLNPRHLDASRVRAVRVRRWTYDARLLRGR